MAGYILLAGGAEFGGQMVIPDRRAMELAGGPGVPICIIPAAAAPNNTHRRLGTNGVNWFRNLGAHQARLVPLIGRNSANDTSIVAQLGRARLIYLLGGFPGYLAETLSSTQSWYAIHMAYEQGAVVAGSGAGAMVLCQYYFDPARQEVMEGLGLLPNTCLLPRYNVIGKEWASYLASLLPGVVLLGIDERTALLDDGVAGRRTGWRVYGQGNVTVYRRGIPKVYPPLTGFVDRFL